MEKKLKILIADDNEKLARNLGDILGLKGYQPFLVKNGYEAVEAVKNTKFNVVLMDVKMPGINGVEALKLLKKTDPDIYAIMITAFADDIFYKNDLDHIEFEILQKPIDIDKLLLMLKKLC